MCCSRRCFDACARIISRKPDPQAARRPTPKLNLSRSAELVRLEQALSARRRERERSEHEQQQACAAEGGAVPHALEQGTEADAAERAAEEERERKERKRRPAPTGEGFGGARLNRGMTQAKTYANQRAGKPHPDEVGGPRAE